MNLVWTRVVHSLLFPLQFDHQDGNRRRKFATGLQFFLANSATSLLGFGLALNEGVKENLFITNNMVIALGITSILLNVYSSILMLVSLTSSHGNDNVNESTPLLLNHREGNNEDSRTSSWSSIACQMTLVILLVAILASFYFVLLLPFNTCPQLSSPSNGKIICSGSQMSVGEECQLACILPTMTPHSTR